MFWLLKKIISLGVLAALVFVLMNVEVKGHPIKDYVVAVYETPMVQGLVGKAKDALLNTVDNLEKKKPGIQGVPGVKEEEKNNIHVKDEPPLDSLKEDEVKELEKVLKKQNKK